MKRNKQRLLLCSLLAVLVLLAAPTLRMAHAATCAFDSVSTLNFGNYDVFDAGALLSTGNIRYTCSAVVPGDTVRIDLSTGTGGTSFTPRELANGGDTMDYNIYLDAARTAIWGDGSGVTSFYTQTNPPDGTPVNVITYGRIPPGQDIPAGFYTSTITVTMSF